MEDLDDIEMNESEVKSRIHEFSTTKLCDLIINYRYLGLFRELYVASMEELSKRRQNGDNFDFEKYIEENLNKLPKITLQVDNLYGALEQLRKLTGK